MRLPILRSICLATLLSTGFLHAQTAPAPAATRTAVHSGTSSTPAVKKPRRRRTRTTTIQMETSSPARSSNTVSAADASAARAQQRAEDARVLARQQARSDKEARINNEQVRQAQARQDAQANEVRIQDAPGPAQTGVVPAAGQPVQPLQDQRIQDQPSAVPGQNTTPPQP